MMTTRTKFLKSLHIVFVMYIMYIFEFQFYQESGRRRTTMWMCYLQIVISLFRYEKPLKTTLEKWPKMFGNVLPY